jgi:Na+/glutamate symporter
MRKAPTRALKIRPLTVCLFFQTAVLVVIVIVVAVRYLGENPPENENISLTNYV